MKKIFAFIAVSVIFLSVCITNVGALALSQYTPVIGSANMGAGYLFQQSYPTFNDFDFYALSENTPIYNTDEDEVRITYNYMKLEVPRIINHGMQATSDWDPSLIAVSIEGTFANYMYASQMYHQDSVGTLITSVNAGDPNGVTNLRSFNVATLSSNVPSALYAVGSCYGRVINNVPYSVGFTLSETCTISIQGQFYLTRIDNGEVESIGVNTSSTYSGMFYITPSILSDEYSSVYSLDEFVFSGQIYIIPTNTTSTALPSIRVWYDINDIYYAEVNNSVLGSANRDGYKYNPIIEYLYGAYTVSKPDATLNITENGFYNLTNYTYANVNVPQTLEWSGMFDWIFDSIGAFMSFEIAPGWSIGILMSIAVSLAVGIWLMRLFMGG